MHRPLVAYCRPVSRYWFVLPAEEFFFPPSLPVVKFGEPAMSLARRFAFAFSLWLVAVVTIAAHLPRADPESVGLSSERLAKIRKRLGAEVRPGVIPGYGPVVAMHGTGGY